MSATVQSVSEAVKNATSAATAVASSAISAAVGTAPPTAPHADTAVPTGDAAPGEQDKQSLLSPQDEKAKEQLEKLLDQRPDRKELVDRNILKGSNVAPGLQAKQAELERARLEDALASKLQARPSPDELVKEGILNSDEVPGK